MSFFDRPCFLPRVIGAAAAADVGFGALQVGFAEPMAEWTGLPAPLLFGSGAFLLVYAVMLARIATQRPPARLAIGLVALANIGWAVGSVALLVASANTLSAQGMAWLLPHAVAVTAFADLQWLGLRGTRTRTQAALARIRKVAVAPVQQAETAIKRVAEQGAITTRFARFAPR